MPRDLCGNVAEDLLRDDAELVPDHLVPINLRDMGNQSFSKLIDEPEVPENQERSDGYEAPGSGTLTAPEAHGPGKQRSQTHDENGSKRNEEAVAKGKASVPPGIDGNQAVEQNRRYDADRADLGILTVQREQAENGQNQDGSPDKQAVIRGKEHGAKIGGVPIPGNVGVHSQSPGTAINDLAGNQHGRKGHNSAGGKQQVEAQITLPLAGIFAAFAPSAQVTEQAVRRGRQHENSVCEIHVHH